MNPTPTYVDKCVRKNTDSGGVRAGSRWAAPREAKAATATGRFPLPLSQASKPTSNGFQDDGERPASVQLRLHGSEPIDPIDGVRALAFVPQVALKLLVSQPAVEPE